jgi:hypothetical protein
MPIPDIKFLIDEKLKRASLEELLDEYSKLYSDSTEKIIELSESYEKETNSNPAMYLAASASICRNVSEAFLKQIK